MIKLINVSKIYNAKKKSIKALDLINCVLPNTGFVGVTGENGCGKTTLLNVVSTLDSDFEGEIFIDQYDVKKDLNIVRSKKVSYVFQENYFIDNLSILDNLKIVNSENEQIEERLKEFKLLEKEKSFSNTLSGGQKQRASVARGLLKPFDILLVDEPTCSMNEEMEMYVFKILKQLSKEKLVLLVSHNKTMLYSFCDIVIKLNEGRIENITRNSTSLDLKYIDNKIYFTNELNFKAIDNSIAKDIVEKYGEIIIRRDIDISNTPKLDYAIYNIEYSNVGYMDKISYNIMKKSIFKYFLKISFSFIFVISFLIFLFECVIDFKSFDSNEFIYSTLVSNQETFVNATISSSESDCKKFDISNLNLYSKKFENRIETVCKIENGKTFPFENDEFFNNNIQSINMSNFKEVNFLEGNIPKVYDSYVITDYIADACILKMNEYKTYEDIITKGIFIDGYIISISGIIDTDYEKYKMKFYNFENDDSINYNYNLSNVYGSIYYANNASISEERLGFAYISNGDFYADIEIDKVILDNKCVVNRSFAEFVAYDGSDNFPVKYENGYIYIDRVIDDEKQNPTMYLNDKYFSQFLSARIKNFDGINVKISSQASTDFLIDNLITFNCYSGTYMYKIINTINILGYLFLGIILFLIIIILLFILSFLKKIFKNSSRIYVFQSMFGYKKKYLLSAELCTISLILLSVCTLNLFFYFGLYFMMNNILSSLFSTKINMFLYSFSTVVISISLCIALVYLIYFVLYKIRINTNLITLINNK